MIKCSQKSFYDLNIQESCVSNEDSRKYTLETLYNLGYRTIAVNQIIDVDSSDEPKKKKKKGEPRESTDFVPLPFDLQQLKDIASELNLRNLTFLNRITLIFSTQDNLQKFIKSPNFKKFNLVGVMPTTMQALMFVCGNLEADIISFDLESKMNLRLNRKVYFQLIERGYHFELTYADAIEDSTKRKNLIHLSHMYHTYGKARNILFSSGARNVMFLRSPYDIISIGFLFGLNELQSKNAVSHCPRNITVNAIGRTRGKAVMLVENIQAMDITETTTINDPAREDEEMDIDEPVTKRSKQ